MRPYKLASKKVLSRRLEYAKSRGARYVLKLECGHTAFRRASINGGTCKRCHCEVCFQERLKGERNGV